MHGVAKRLTPEQVWIARLFRAACADERVLGRLGVSVDPMTGRGGQDGLFVGSAGGFNVSAPADRRRRSAPAVEDPEECAVPM